MCNIVADFITEQPQHARSRFAVRVNPPRTESLVVVSLELADLESNNVIGLETYIITAVQQHHDSDDDVNTMSDDDDDEDPPQCRGCSTTAGSG